MRRRARGKILEIVMTNYRPRPLEADSHPRHPRVAIGIRKIDIAADEDVAVIRATRRDDQRREENDLNSRDDASAHRTVLIEIRESRIENQSGWSSAAGHDLFETVAGL